MKAIRLCLAVCLLVSADAAGQQPLRIAAASDLQPVLPALIAQFEREAAEHIDVSFGSSGNFYAQLQNGAPFDLFFSADIDYPKRLESSGLTAPGTLIEYATGRIALWTRTDSGLDLGRGFAILSDPRVRRIAIANPEHAPYGRAAVAALRHEHLEEQLRPRLVLGENISQAAQFVQSGNADVGIVALSLALAPAMREMGRFVEVPASFYPPIGQAAVVLRASLKQDIARRFLAFMQQPGTQRALRVAGFAPPQGGR